MALYPDDLPAIGSLPRELSYCRKTCPECPWRRDVPLGQFPPERYIALAPTSYDMSPRVFACHKSPEDRAFACAGAVLRQEHNMAFRFGQVDRSAVEAAGPLFDGFREMAIANGVPADHPALEPVRDD